MKADAFHKCNRADISHLRTVKSRDTQRLVVGYLRNDAIGFQQLGVAFDDVKYFSDRGTRIACKEANAAL